MPSQLERLRQSFYNLAESTIQKYIGFCDYGLDEIKLDKRELLNGSIKNEMTQWWLQLIATKVENFVEEKGYDMDAVPYDYLEMPPKVRSRTVPARIV